MAVTRHEPRYIAQAGANPGDRLTWDGAKWAPATPSSGADGNGIYTGNGNIGQGVASSTTRATLGNDATFRIDYNDGSFALWVTDVESDALDIHLKSNNTVGSWYLDGVGSLDAISYFDLPDRDNSGLGIRGRTKITSAGSPSLARPKAILELNSTKYAFYPPRMTGAQRDAIAGLDATDNGAVLYNTTTNALNVYVHPTWGEISDGDGIYGGSGSIPDGTAATVSEFGEFTFNWFGGVDAFKIDDNNDILSIISHGGLTVSEWSDGGFSTTHSTNNVVMEALTASVRLAYDDGGSAPQSFIVDSTGARVDSVTKMLRPPRMTTAQRTGGTLTETGGLVYDTTTNKMYYRDNTGFIEIGNGAAGNGGIYGGSGTIASAVQATLTNTFAIRYVGGSVSALSAIDSLNSISLQSKDTHQFFRLNNTNIQLYTNSGNTEIIWDDTTESSEFRTFITSAGGTIDTKALLDVNSTTLAFFPPRMTTVQRDAMGAVNDGAMLYDTTSDRLNIRANGAWATLSSTNLSSANGAAGRVAYFTSADVIEGENIFIWDATNNRLGVNATTPGYTLTVGGASKLNGRVYVEGTGNTFTGDGASALFIENSAADGGFLAGTNDARKTFLGEIHSGVAALVAEIDDTNSGQQFSMLGAFAYRSEETLGPFGANQNNLAINVNTSVVKVSSSVAIDITGMLGDGANHSGRQVVLFNTGTNNIILKSNNASSAAANRFLTRGNGDVTIPENGAAVCWYDNAASRWRIVSVS